MPIFYLNNQTAWNNVIWDLRTNYRVAIPFGFVQSLSWSDKRESNDHGAQDFSPPLGSETQKK